MLKSLLTAFPSEGYRLYQTLDYWTCRELLEIENTAKSNPSDRLQELQNNTFNDFLDSNSEKKIKWSFLDKSYTLRDILDYTKTIVD